MTEVSPIEDKNQNNFTLSGINVSSKLPSVKLKLYCKS